MPRLLNLALLGGFRASLGGQPLTSFQTEKARALLAYLAVEADRLHERLALADLLWPYIAEEYALRNLSQTLVRLRQAIRDQEASPPFLRITRQSLQFNRQSHHLLDVTEFETGLTESRKSGDLAQLEAATALYGGEFLAGFDLADSEHFGEWLLFKREYLHRLALDGLSALTAAYLTAGDYSRAQYAASRQLALDAWRETAHRQLMTALVQSGQRAAALLHYETCRRLLRAELDVEPEAETTALYEWIRGGESADQGTRLRPKGLKSEGWQEAKGTKWPAGDVPWSLQYDWDEAPDLGSFYGRETELATVARWLVDEDCRVVALVGIGGVGKTALAAQAVPRVVGHFDLVIWRSLLNAPPLEEVLRGCLATLSAQQLTDLPASLDEQLQLLLDYLRQRRCLLVLDNLESILQSGETPSHYRAGYTGYSQLLLRLGQTRHQSCLLLTSREEPPEFTRLSTGDGRQGAVRILTLQGLTSEAAQILLSEHGVASGDLTPLVHHYSGHPLALKLVADTIRDVYAGAVDAFLGEETPIFDDIRTVLDEQVDRLSPLEQDILTWLAIAREPVTIAALQADLLQPPARWAVLEAVRNLRRRSLLETQAEGFRLQNVVIEYITGRLVDQVGTWLLDVGLTQAPAQRLDLHTAILNRFTLAKANAREYARQSQVRLIVEPIARRLVMTLGTSGVAATCHRLLAAVRATAPRLPGYAAGNLLTLLLQLGYDLHGYDFSQLCVWQVDLRGQNARGLNLSESDLSGSVFTDLFQLVNDLAFQPTGAAGGHLLAVAVSDGSVRLWQWRTGQLAALLAGHTGFVWCVAFSPDGQRLASGGADGTVRLWTIDESLGQGRLLHTLHGHTGWVRSIAFQPQGTLLATAGWDQTIRLWQLHRSGEITAVAVLTEHRTRLQAIAFSPDGALLASAGYDQVIYLWDVARQSVIDTLVGHTDTIKQLAFTPDGKRLLSCSWDRTLRLWDVERGRTEHLLQGHTHAIAGLALSPDGALAISVGDEPLVRVWDLLSGRLARLLHGHASWVTAVAFHRQGGIIATSSWDQTVRLWNPHTGQALHTFQGYTHVIETVAFSPDGALLASGGNDEQITLWEVATGRMVRTLAGASGWVHAVSFSPDGTLLASASGDGRVWVWQVAEGVVLATWPGPRQGVSALVFSPDGTLLVSGGADPFCYLWSLHGAGQQFEHGHGAWLMAVAFHPEGALLATAGTDGVIVLWDLLRLRSAPETPLVSEPWVVRRLVGHPTWVETVAFSPDGRWLASAGGDGAIQIWEVATGAVRAVLQGHQDNIHRLVFSPGTPGGSALLASASHDGSVRVWELSAAAGGGQLRHTLAASSSWVRGLAFHADGRTLASAGYAGVIQLWDTETGQCRQVLRPAGPYEGMKITGVTGITEAQRVALKSLGAVET